MKHLRQASVTHAPYGGLETSNVSYPHQVQRVYLIRAKVHGTPALLRRLCASEGQLADERKQSVCGGVRVQRAIIDHAHSRDSRGFAQLEVDLARPAGKDSAEGDVGAQPPL